MIYGQPDRPEGLEEDAACVGAIYWVPGKGDVVVGWDPQFLKDIHEQGHTKALIKWARKLGDRLADEFKGRRQ